MVCLQMKSYDCVVFAYHCVAVFRLRSATEICTEM